MTNVLLFIILFEMKLSFSHYFVMTPIDHSYCLDRSQRNIMNKVPVGPKMLMLKINPNVKLLKLTKSNSLCSAILIQPLGKRVRHVTNKDSSWIYWYLSIKIYGQFSSCADYLLVGDVGEEYTDNDLERSRSNALRLHCRSELPAVIQTKQRHIIVWWHWSRETQPDLILEISSYIQYRGPWTIPEKINACVSSMGFWCSEVSTCIHGSMRCDGINNCDSFSRKSPSSYGSADELDCHIINNITGIPIDTGKPIYESKWIGHSLYILLGVTILILIISAFKICLHNSTLSSRLHKSQSVASMQSSSSSSNYDKPEEDPEDVYDELPPCAEGPSPNISIDEDTNEELISASVECLERNCHCEIFQPRHIGPNNQSTSAVTDRNTPTRTPSQGPSQTSSQYQSTTSIHAPLTARTTHAMRTTDSVTGSILAHGQDVIARLNMPGSTRTMRNKLWKKLRTSSYDKINEGVAPSQVSENKEITSVGSDGKKSKSYTISRLEMNSQSQAEADEYFTSFVII